MTLVLHRILFRVSASLVVLGLAVPAAAQQPAAPPDGPQTAAPASDLDQLMARVLANRDHTWRALQEYLLDEREAFRLVGPDGAPMFGLRKDFVWVARDGRAVRSPVRINGVAVSDEVRRREEAKWEAEEDRRAAKSVDKSSAPAATTGDVEEVVTRGEPRFISEVQFLRFRFEPGNYYFAGRGTLAGRDVLRIEYYPRRLFSDQADKPAAGGARGKDDEMEDRLEQAFNKVSLVTLWIDPLVDQIVRYTFDNVDFNFLPGRSFVRVDTATATMTMGQPFEGIWLPESLTIEGAVTLATGTYRAEYSRRFSDYRQADVQMRFRVKDQPDQQ